MRLLIFLALLSASTISVMAQDNSLDPVTVTAALVPERASKTGRNIITIKGERFNEMPVTSIDELLRFLPGVEMQMRGPAGSQGDITMRGSTFQQVLVLLDGIRLNDPNTGHFSGYIPVAPAEIDRIEILKGASSSIYGSEAVGGVIHIITKTFAAKNNVSRKSLQGQVMAGEFGLLNANIGGMYQRNKTAVSAGLLSNNAEGQQQRGIRGYFHNHTASASVNHYFNDRLNISLRSAYDSRDFAAQNFYTTFASDTAREKVKTLWNQLRLAYQKGNTRLVALAGYKSTDDEFRFNNTGAPNRSKSRLGQASVIFDQQINSRWNYVTGIQYQNKSINSNDRGQHSLHQAGIFGGVNWRPITGLTINPSLRVDMIETIGAELVPQVNLSYQHRKWQLRASGGKTIRDADFTERFNNYNRPFVPSGRIGNPDLEQERSFSYEAGFDYIHSSIFRFSSSFFQRFHNKLIDYVPTPYAEMPRQVNLSPTGTYALAKNIANVNTTGFEADVQYIKEYSAHSSLWITTGILWLNSESSSGTPSFYVSSHARLLTNFNVQYRYKILRATLSGIYKKRNAQSAPAINAKVSPDYFVLNARVDTDIVRNRFSLFVMADNIFNRDYQDLLGSQMPGRWLMGGLKVQWQ